MNLSRTRRLSLGIVLIVAADWLTKFWVQNRFFEGSIRPVVDGWIWLAHRRNPGVAFSILADMPAGLRLPLLALTSLGGIYVCARMLASTEDPHVASAAGLVIAGAVGNLGDRLLNGAVTDFILLNYFPFVFNVADVAITAGAILLASRLLLDEGSRAAAPSPADAGGPATP
jgi:signal peptidase II